MKNTVPKDVFLSFLECLNSPLSLGLWIRIKYDSYDDLTSVSIDPLGYNSPELFRQDHAALSFVEKYGDFPTSFNKKDRAIEKWIQAEQSCVRTNARLYRLVESYNQGKTLPALEAYAFRILQKAKSKIQSLLGEYKQDEHSTSCRFGPKTNRSIKGSRLAPYFKYDVVSATCPKRLRPQLSELLFGHSLLAHYIESSDPVYCSPIVECSDSGTVLFVPKSSKTDRPICAESHFGSYAQLGLGAMIRRRLRRVGVDLNDQTRNQELAKLGSLTGHLATLDLSSASDTVSYFLVHYLLPDDWFDAMVSCRTTHSEIQGKRYRLEKWSSMGNGYTFELESMIFWALVSSCPGMVTDQLSVYGDDIIIPSSLFSEVSSILEYFGFTVNKKKSFSSGYFRESCGAQYFRGLDCRPLYFKERLKDVQSVFVLANGIRRLASRHLNGYGCCRSFLPSWTYVLSRIPSALRSHRIPDGYGDGGILSTFDEATPKRSGRDRGWSGFRTKHLSFHPSKVKMTSLIPAILHSFGSGENPSGGFADLSGVGKWQTRSLYVIDWHDIGGWF